MKVASDIMKTCCRCQHQEPQSFLPILSFLSIGTVTVFGSLFPESSTLPELVTFFNSTFLSILGSLMLSPVSLSLRALRKTENTQLCMNPLIKLFGP
jgi:hypothetical protein